VSATATGWTFRHSPYKHGDFAVHLALADAANDLNGNELWFGLEKLAKKARVGRNTAQAAVAKMVRDGYLETLRERGGPGTYAIYRFVFVKNASLVFRQETTGTKAGRPKTGPVGGNTSNERPQHVQLANSSPLIEPKEPNSSSSAKKRSAPIDESFAVTDEMRQWATVKGIRSDIESQTELFRNHFEAKGDSKVNWAAAWRNWLIRADGYASMQTKPGQSKSKTAIEAVMSQITQPTTRSELNA
jgi:hypothetical protein